MKTHEEMFESVLRRRDEYEIKKYKRNKALISAAAGVCSLAIVICGVTLYSRNNAPGKSQETAPAINMTEIKPDGMYETFVEDETKETNTIAENYVIDETATQAVIIEETTSVITATTKPVKTNTANAETAKPESADEMKAEAGDRDAALPYISGVNIALKGETITDAELKAYIKKNAEYMVASVAFDLGKGEYRVCTKGYRPLTVSAQDGLFINTGFVDCPITKDGKIVAVVTVYKDNGVLYDSVAYGGNGFATIQRAFDENPDEDLVFIYVNEVPEVIITKENKMYFIPSSVGFNKNYDYYTLYKTEANTFSKGDLDNNYISVTV